MPTNAPASLPVFTIKIFTLYPECFPGTLGISLPQRGLKNNIWKLQVINIKDFAEDKHKTVDDKPYGGGVGMLLKPNIISKALDQEIDKDLKSTKNTQESRPTILITSARGHQFNQDAAEHIVRNHTLNQYQFSHTIYIICPRFEGIDERIIQHYQAIEVNLGRFVLFGGEAAAMCICEAIIRLLPGAIDTPESLKEESYTKNTSLSNLMEHAQYTQPAVWRNMPTPPELTEGNHNKIKHWKLSNAKEITHKYSRQNLVSALAEATQATKGHKRPILSRPL